MDNKPTSSENYTLLLTSYRTNSNNDNNPIPFDFSLNNVTWNVDYDSLFKGRQDLFKHCRVRYSLYQGSQTYSVYSNQVGYLAASFQSSYNGPCFMPTILGLIYAQQNPNTNTVDQVYIASTLNECGVDIDLQALAGRQCLNIKFCNDDTFSPILNIIENYEIMLQFQLYN